jgi:hypothetical protein
MAVRPAGCGQIAERRVLADMEPFNLAGRQVDVIAQRPENGPIPVGHLDCRYGEVLGSDPSLTGGLSARPSLVLEEIG